MNPLSIFFVLSAVLGFSMLMPVRAAERPNVVFIVIDDQNDWVGALGGHPMVRTPNMDRLAARGTVFLNAHCNAPLCNPSRTSVMSGLRPTTTGIYGLLPWFRDVPELKDLVTLPQYFKTQGYRTLTTGKVFHGDPGEERRKAEFDVWGPDGGVGVRPKKKLIGPTPMGNNPLMDWGEFPHKDEDKGDYKVASWASGQIKSAPKDQPFFLATGFSLPHVPCYATKKWFDLYPDDDRVLPEVKEDDRADTPRFSWYLHWELPEPRLEWVRKNGQWRNLVRSYLASTSFVDAQVGRVLDSIDEAGIANNTIVVVWGDNGYHLGEKAITGKNSLWGNSTRVPLIFAGPGVKSGQRCTRPAELLDLYPTLVDLCELAPRPGLEGLSLLPQLKDAASPRERPVVTTHNPGNHAVRSERWRYIRYADHSEELYDVQADPKEWKNLAGDPKYSAVISEHQKWLPKTEHPPAPGSANRLLSYDPATDEATWEGKTVKRSDPIPQ